MYGAIDGDACARNADIGAMLARASPVTTPRLGRLNMRVLLLGEANQLVLKRHSMLHVDRGAAATLDRRRRTVINAAPADHVERFQRIRQSLRRQKRGAVGDLKMHMRLGRVS